MKTKNIPALLLTAVAAFIFFTIVGSELTANPNYQDNGYQTEFKSLNGSGTSVALGLTVIFALVFYMLANGTLSYFQNRSSADSGDEELNKNGILSSSMLTARDKALLAKAGINSAGKDGIGPAPVSVIVLSAIAAGINFLVCLLFFILIGIGGTDKSDPKHTRIELAVIIFAITAILSIFVSFFIVINLISGKRGQLKISLIITMAQSLLPAIFNPFFGVELFVFLLIPLLLYRKAYKIDKRLSAPTPVVS